MSQKTRSMTNRMFLPTYTVDKHISEIYVVGQSINFSELWNYYKVPNLYEYWKNENYNFLVKWKLYLDIFQIYKDSFI